MQDSSARILASRALRIAALAAASALAACSSGAGDGAGGGAATGGAGGGPGARPPDPPVVVDLQGRAYDLIEPTSYDKTKPAPLLVEIHGFFDAAYTMTPWLVEESENHFAAEADARGVLLALVHAQIDPVINHFAWNATDSCCDFDDLGTNDVGYVMAVIDDIAKDHAVDPKRIFVFGHSNGAFMANRLGCDEADRFAGVVSLAGATYKDQSKCAASAPIAFLQVHGDADELIPYAGGPPEGIAVLPPAPGAVETTRDWAVKNRCELDGDTSGPAIDVVTDLDGAETTKLVFAKGCEANGQTELWTIHGGVHSPAFGAAWAPAVFDFLMAHPKP